jgi:aldehyde dehydrogenase (NAD+)
LLAFSSQRTIIALPTWLDAVMGSSYPPYKMANKTVVKNSLGFKKGETMAEQKISMPRN